MIEMLPGRPAISRWTKQSTKRFSSLMAGKKIINVHDAKTHFSKLLERVRRGEEIIIARDGTPVARLCPLQEKLGPRVPGTAKGRIVMSDDFDAPIPDLERAIEN